MEKYYAAYFCLGRVIKDSLVEYLISEARSSLVEFSSSRYLQVTSSYFFCGVLKAFSNMLVPLHTGVHELHCHVSRQALLQAKTVLDLVYFLS